MASDIGIHLEPFELADINRLIAWLDSPEVFWYWTAAWLRYPLTYEQYAPKVAESKATPPARYIFRAVETTSAAVVGHIELSLLRPEAGTATVGRILVAPAYRSKGLGKRRVQAAIE